MRPRIRLRSSSSVSRSVAKKVGRSFVTESIPKIGRLMSAIAPGATAPAGPSCWARTGTTTESWSRRSVRGAVVSNTWPSCVETSVPTAMEMSPGAGVVRLKRTSPEANLASLRVTSSSAATWSSAEPVARSTNADS